MTGETVEIYPNGLIVKGVQVLLSPDEMGSVVASMRRTVRAYKDQPMIVGTQEFQRLLDVLEKLDNECGHDHIAQLGVERG